MVRSVWVPRVSGVGVGMDALGADGADARRHWVTRHPSPPKQIGVFAQGGTALRCAILGTVSELSPPTRGFSGLDVPASWGHAGWSWLLRKYRQPVARPRAAPVWDSALWRRATDPPNQVCLPVGVLTVLAPGDSGAVAGVAFPVRAVLGDSLPAARYRLTAQFHGELEAGTVELRAPPT